jgi:hypothetical protein
MRGATDTTGMRFACVRVAAAVLAVTVWASAVEAGWPWHRDRCQPAGTSFDDTGCGPRVYGPCHEPVGPVDQCDACARFSGCEGYRQRPEILAPWQLPPGRGFQPPENFGYLPTACAECAACGPRGQWLRHW